MLVEFLKEMIKENIYYREIEELKIWHEKEKNTGKSYFVIKLGSDKECINI